MYKYKNHVIESNENPEDSASNLPEIRLNSAGFQCEILTTALSSESAERARSCRKSPSNLPKSRKIFVKSP